MLTRAAPGDIVPIEVAAGPLAGLKMELDLSVEKDLWLATYEPAVLQAIQHWVKPGMVTYDVGANIGYVSLALARAVGAQGQVVAFEPLPENVSRLRTNIELNPEGARVRVVEAAVSDRAERSQFLIHRSGAMGKLESSKGRAGAYQEEITVEVIGLDDWIAEGKLAPPELIKIDVEGGEAAVLEGMSGALKNDRPTILIELHGPEAAGAVQEILASAGYALHAMRDGYPELGEITSWKTYAVALPVDHGIPGT
ncbi:MAG: FkbM family methyltransferase [Anaerolineae bacterium]|nr:MAG: FkbM family methyltransferase [Anaerolineae bacterium]